MNIIVCICVQRQAMCAGDRHVENPRLTTQVKKSYHTTFFVFFVSCYRIRRRFLRNNKTISIISEDLSRPFKIGWLHKYLASFHWIVVRFAEFVSAGNRTRTFEFVRYLVRTKARASYCAHPHFLIICFSSHRLSSISFTIKNASCRKHHY